MGEDDPAVRMGAGPLIALTVGSVVAVEEAAVEDPGADMATGMDVDMDVQLSPPLVVWAPS